MRCLIILCIAVCAAAVTGADLSGQPARAFEAVEWLDGEGYALKDLEGKTAVLYVWTTWSPVCQAIAPAVSETYKTLKESGIVFLALTGERNASRIGNFLADNGGGYPVGLGSNIEEQYAIEMLPYFIVINKQGLIQGATSSIEDLQDLIKEATASNAVAEPVHAAENPQPEPALEPEEADPLEVLIELLVKGEKESRVLVKKAEEAQEYLDELEQALDPLPDDRKVISRAVKVLSRFLSSRIPDVQIKAVEMLGLFQDNQTAFASLAKLLGSLARRDVGFRPLQIAVIKSIPKTARFNSAAASILFKVIENNYKAGTEVINEALIAYRDVRTYASCDCLVKAIAKLAPDPEDPNDYFGGDDTKRSIWTAVQGSLWASLQDLTGESTGYQETRGGRGGRRGAAFGSSLKGYSTWKRWIQDNKGGLLKKFRQEQEAAAGK